MQRGSAGAELFVKLEKCHLCFLSGYLPDVIEQMEADVRLAEEFALKYNLCENPVDILKRLMTVVVDASLFSMDIPPEDNFNQ